MKGKRYWCLVLVLVLVCLSGCRGAAEEANLIGSDRAALAALMAVFGENAESALDDLEQPPLVTLNTREGRFVYEVKFVTNVPLRTAYTVVVDARDGAVITVGRTK